MDGFQEMFGNELSVRKLPKKKIKRKMSKKAKTTLIAVFFIGLPLIALLAFITEGEFIVELVADIAEEGLSGTFSKRRGKK